jgi:hypothetical protein
MRLEHNPSNFNPAEAAILL